MWGFVSVMLALLFLLMPWTVVHPRGPTADLAIARHSTPMPGALREDTLKITITRDGMVFFRDYRVMPKDLADAIRKGVGNGAEKRVYLKADARAKYGDVTAVLDQIRLSGIENVTLLTETPYRDSPHN